MSQNETQKVSTHQDVLAEVANALAGSPQQVRSKLVNLLVDREVTKRVDLLDKGLAKLRELKREVEKIRPPVSYTPDGQKVDGNFSKADYDNLKKAKERVSKLESALEKAFAGQEFDKLTNLVAGKEAPTESSDE